MQEEVIAKETGLSFRTIQRSFNETDEFLYSLKSKPNSIKNKTTQQQLDHAKNFIDHEIPIQSGRDYRIQLIPDHDLFLKYQSDAQNSGVEPFSKTYFLYTLLKKENIRKSKDSTICTICSDYHNVCEITERELTIAEQKTKTQGEEHRETWQEQSKYYKDLKNKIGTGELKHDILIVHDFTQVFFFFFKFNFEF